MANFFYGVAAGLVVALVVALVRWWWTSRQKRVAVELEDGLWWHVTNGGETVRVNAVGARVRRVSDGAQVDVDLSGQRVYTKDHRQDDVITLQPHAEERFGPPEDLGTALLKSGARAVQNRIRLRPFVRVDGRKTPCYGSQLTYDLQTRTVVRGH